MEINKGLFLDAAEPHHWEGRITNDGHMSGFVTNARFGRGRDANVCPVTGVYCVCTCSFPNPNPNPVCREKVDSYNSNRKNRTPKGRSFRQLQVQAQQSHSHSLTHTTVNNL